MAAPEYKDEVRRFLVEKLNHATGDWSRALNDARIAEEQKALFEKALAEFDATGRLIV